MLQNSLNQSIILLLVLALSFGILGASDELPLSEIFVPYDDEGFYGGGIVLFFMFYIAIFIIGILIQIIIIFLIAGIISFFFFPKIINEFKLLIGLYYDAEWSEALSRHFIHFLIFIPLALTFLFTILPCDSSKYHSSAGMLGNSLALSMR